MALLKLCRCGKKIDYNIQYCNECMEIVDNENRQIAKRYDREVRYSDSNKQYTEFYNSIAWRTLSDVVKGRYNGMCVACIVDDGELVESDTTHHIEELRECWDLRLVESNLIPLCHSCHNSIHSNYSEKEKNYLKNIIKKYKKLFKN